MCTECVQAFIQKAYLNIKIHSGEKLTGKLSHTSTSKNREILTHALNMGRHSLKDYNFIH